MKTITVGFSRPISWKPFAWAIMKSYGTNYDHVYVKFHSDSYQRDIIYQASSVMVNFMSPTIFEDKNVVVKEFPVSITDENYVKMMQFCIDNAGKPYSLKEVCGFALQVIAGWFGKKIDNPLKEGNKEYVCSVMAAYISSQFAGVVLNEEFEDVTPKELYELLEKLVPVG